MKGTDSTIVTILLGFKLFGKACGQLCAHENRSWRPVAVSRDRERGVLTMLAVPPHEACPARALPADVVTVSSVLALADRGTVLPKIPQGTPCNTSRGRGKRDKTAALEVEDKHTGSLCS